MFERYTEEAKQVIFFAGREANLFGSPYIESQHLLLGLLEENKALLHAYGTTLESIRKHIEGRTPLREEVSTPHDLPLSDECKRILAYAAEEANSLSHKHIGTEHLVLGVLRAQDCFAAASLRERGITLEIYREQIQNSLSGQLGTTGPTFATNMTRTTSTPVFGGKPGEPVPAVDPDDLKAVWQLHRDQGESYPGERIAIGTSIMAAACKPGADIAAIAHRAGQLGLATQVLPQQLAKLHNEGYLDDTAYRAVANELLPGQLSSRMKDGQPDDAFFRAAATVSMEWMGVGVVRDGLPFNMDEFARLLAEVNDSGK